MSTRSCIAVQVSDGTFRAIYCHSDGYPSYNGAMLIQHYTERAKVEELVSLGDLSVLDENIGTQFDFNDKRPEGSCRFYGRDRGETGIEFKVFASLDDLKENFEYGQEYFYAFTLENKWLIANYNSSFRPLTYVECDLDETQKEVTGIISNEDLILFRLRSFK